MSTITTVVSGNRRLAEARIGNTRARAKHEAVKDFEDCDTLEDVEAILQYANEQMLDAPTPVSRAYWVAYWTRMTALEREARK